MTNEHREACRKRLAARTPGEWEHHRGYGPHELPYVLVNTGADGNIDCLDPIGHHIYKDPACDQAQTDCSFVAHSPADIEALLAEVDEWRELWASVVEAKNSNDLSAVCLAIATKLEAP